MPTATGFIQSVGGSNKFTATFTIDGLLYSYNSNMNPTVKNFISNNAILEYNNKGDLTGQQNFSGQVGVNLIKLKINGRLEISGRLNTPISPGIRVAGAAT